MFLVIIQILFQIHTTLFYHCARYNCLIIIPGRFEWGGGGGRVGRCFAGTLDFYAWTMERG